MKAHFHSSLRKKDEFALLITIFVNENMTPSAEFIQDEIIRRSHYFSKWYEFEIVSEGPKHTFESREICVGKNCIRSFVVEYKTNFYFVAVDNAEKIAEVIRILEETESFNPIAFFLIYLKTDEANVEKTVERILKTLVAHFMIYGAVLVAQNQTVFNLYQMSFHTVGPTHYCASNMSIYIMDRCVNGKHQNKQVAFA